MGCGPVFEKKDTAKGNPCAVRKVRRLPTGGTTRTNQEVQESRPSCRDRTERKIAETMVGTETIRRPELRSK